MCVFVSHGAKLPNQTIVSSATMRADVKNPALPTTRSVEEADAKITLFLAAFLLPPVCFFAPDVHANTARSSRTDVR